MRESLDTRERRQLIAKLSAAEFDVLLLACRGMTMKQCAMARGTSEGTIITQKRKLLKKLEVHTLIEAAVIAAKAGVV